MIKLPSRYEDLDSAFRGRLLPNKFLIEQIQKAIKSMQINGGIRFLPIFGISGSGKSCSSIELSTHMPDVKTIILTPREIENRDDLIARIKREKQLAQNKVLIAIIDQFEESVIGKERIPSQFIEHLSILDRNELKDEKCIFLWLTTQKQFQKLLAEATSRNVRILSVKDFEIKGPEKKSGKKSSKTLLLFTIMRNP